MNKALLLLLVVCAAVMVSPAEAQEITEERALGVLEKILDLFAGFFDQIIQSLVEAIKEIFNGGGDDQPGYDWASKSAPEEAGNTLLDSAADLINAVQQN